MCLAIPGKLLSRTTAGALATGKVEFGGITREVCLDFVPEAVPGDYVLVHVGFAISRIDAAEAQRTYAVLEQLDALREELGPEPAESA